MEKLSKVREIMISRVDVATGPRKTSSQCCHQNDEQCGYPAMEDSDWTTLYYWNSEQCGCAENAFYLHLVESRRGEACVTFIVGSA